MDFFNEYSGLISFVGAFAAIAGVIVTFYIRRKDKKEKRQELLDEYEIRERMDKFPMTHEDREYFAQKEILKKKLKK